MLVQQIQPQCAAKSLGDNAAPDILSPLRLPIPPSGRAALHSGDVAPCGSARARNLPQSATLSATVDTGLRNDSGFLPTQRDGERT